MLQAAEQSHAKRISQACDDVLHLVLDIENDLAIALGTLESLRAGSLQVGPLVDAATAGVTRMRHEAMRLKESIGVFRAAKGW